MPGALAVPNVVTASSRTGCSAGRFAPCRPPPAYPWAIVSLGCLWLCLALATLGQAQPPEDEALVARARAAVVTLSVKTSHGQGQGTGIVVGADGAVLTAWHLADGVRRAEARLPEDATGFPYLDATALLATEPDKDLALLQFGGRGLPVAPLGDSDTARVGDPVWILGSPRNVEQTLTRGTITAVQPWPHTSSILLLTVPRPYRLAGNSGGPVLDRRGEVIGVVVSVIDRVLAVPVNAAKPMLAASHALLDLDRTPPRSSREQRAERELSSAREAVRLNPDLAEARNWLAFSYGLLHRYVDAVAELEAAIRLNPDSVAAHRMLAETYLDLGQRSRAEEYYEALKGLDPEQAQRLSKSFRR